MAYQTKFVEAVDADKLTELVQQAEREGWEFVSVQVAMAMRQRPSDRADAATSAAFGERPGPVKCMVAALRCPLKKTAGDDVHAADDLVAGEHRA